MTLFHKSSAGFALTLLCGCATLELGTALSLNRLDPLEIDPKTGRIAFLWPDTFTHYRAPFTDFEAVKDGKPQIEGRFNFIIDPASAALVPRASNESKDGSGRLIVYAVKPSEYVMAYKAQDVLRDQKETDTFFGGVNWEMTSHTDFAFTIEREAYQAYCDRDLDFDISIWVKVNEASPFQRLVDKKGIDRFLSGQLKGDCGNPDSILITQNAPD